MTVQECYDKMGGGYDEVSARLKTDERIAKFLVRFLDDKSYELLCQNIQTNTPEAFRAAHTIKGICLNLSLGRLFKSSNALTEALRGKETTEPGALKLFETVKADCSATVSAINELKNSL